MGASGIGGIFIFNGLGSIKALAISLIESDNFFAFDFWLFYLKSERKIEIITS